MTRRILVPLDGTPAADAVLAAARMVAAATCADVSLLRVARAEAADAARAYLVEAAATVRSIGVEVETVVRHGEVDAAIADEAGAWNADLVVVGTSPRKALGHRLVGSVAERVLRQTDVPLLVVGPTARPLARLERILVPVDGSPGGALAVAAAAELARVARARLVLLRVAVPLPLWVYDPTLGLNTGPLINPMWDEHSRTAAEGYVESLAASVRRAGITAEARAALGLVPETIAHVAAEEDADLIAMSTHAHSGPARALLGSVAQQVVAGAHRPVLLVRRRAGAAR